MAGDKQPFPPGTQAQVPRGKDCRPWHKENPPYKCFTNKCFTKRGNALKRPFPLNSRQWIFVGNRLDDFRKGCLSHQGLLNQGPEERSLPKIPHRALRPIPKRGQQPPLKEATLFPKLSPAQRTRKAFLADVEAQLTRHPLALYPNLEEDLPAELLLMVLEVLDPDRKLKDTWASCQSTKKISKEPTKLLNKCPAQVSLGPPKKISVPHPGHWLYKEKKTNETDLLHENGSLLHKNGSSNIDEEFILKQFNVDYQSKTSCNVLRRMRLNQVPLELKKCVGLTKLQEPDVSHKLHCERKLQNPCLPKWVKMRYGAWYLNPKLWKKQRADEPLVDPKISQKAQDENFKKELQEQEEFLADLHGTAAFKEFILSRGYRMPSFLEKMTIRKDCKMCNRTPIK
ncbi:PREDICTED: protein FAM47E [Condylura cristata]|uniref:protein FAM47E n=1 Tax=Condylura cristata TaxID=143302 RepID=UPI000643B7DD|nr:PREDICTED: protein FAM47E [Condylura cristata]